MKLITMTHVLLSALYLLYAPFASAQSINEDTAKSNLVILVYHHVSKDTPASTSVSPEVFAEHMAYLAEHHSVVALDDALHRIQSGQVLPDNAVAITFDDGYHNILENGHSILRQYKFPYTIFINPARIGSSKQLSWQDIAKMEQQGVTFGNHTLDHIHLLDKQPKESDEAWLNRVWLNISEAQKILNQRLTHPLNMLAYPYGEYSASIQHKLREANMIGLAQHSGPINRNSDFTALPRFPAAGVYANMKSLKVKLNTLAYDNVISSISDPVFRHQPPAALSLTFSDSDDFHVNQVNCFLNGESIELTRVSQPKGISMQLPPLRHGRSRVNCTSGSSQPGRYHWYSQPFFVAGKDGQFPD